MRTAKLAVGLIVRCGALTPRSAGFVRRAVAATVPRRAHFTRCQASAADEQFDLRAKYHAGDWRGVWTQVSVDESEATPPQEKKMRTHIELVEDGEATHHVNTPESGEPQDYGIHRKGEPHVAKFLPRAFLYGPGLLPPAAKAPPGTIATEVGLRLADARVRVVFIHAPLPLGGGVGLLKYTVIREADGDTNYAVGRRDLWAEGSKERGPWQGTIQRYNAEEECWINESVSKSTEEDASWCVENRAKWSASPLTLQARPGAPFASDDYLKYDLDGQIRIAVPGRWAAGDQKSLAVEWAPVGAKKCLVARVEILMGSDGAPKMTSFLVEDLDEVLELSD